MLSGFAILCPANLVRHFRGHNFQSTPLFFLKQFLYKAETLERWKSFAFCAYNWQSFYFYEQWAPRKSMLLIDQDDSPQNLLFTTPNGTLLPYESLLFCFNLGLRCWKRSLTVAILPTVPVKELLKSVSIWSRYGQEYGISHSQCVYKCVYHYS